MLAEVAFYRAENIFVFGLGIRTAAGWRYYLPFITVGRPGRAGAVPDACRVSTVDFALPLEDGRVLAATREGDLALIDPQAGAVAARGQLPCLIQHLTECADRREIYLQDAHRLYVLDSQTLAVIRSWHEIEQTGAGWAGYTATEDAATRRAKIRRGTLERLDLIEPVRDLGHGKLAARFAKPGPDAYGPGRHSGVYVFDIATGSIERHRDGIMTKLFGVPPPRAGGIAGLTCEGLPDPGPPAFQALVERDAMVTLQLADAGRAAAMALLAEIADRMERSFDALLICGAIHFRVLLHGAPLDLCGLLDRIEREGWREAAPLLRRSLLTYLSEIEGGEGAMPWSYQGQALRALRALGLLDPDSHDVWRHYVRKGDMEHEPESVTLYGAYLARHGAGGEAGIAFGIAMTLQGRMPGTRLLRDAERQVTAERFAELALAEITAARAEQYGAFGEDYPDYLLAQSTSKFARTAADRLRAAL
jgi:hypothetical protein